MLSNRDDYYRVDPVDYFQTIEEMDSLLESGVVPEWQLDTLNRAREYLSILGSKNWEVQPG